MEIDSIERQKIEICEDEDVVLYEEVAACYKNKLYRSGYLLAWVLLIESLKRKIIKLSDLEDSRGKEQWEIIKKLEEAHKSTDIQIAESAKECEIISDIEFTTINNLWNQRCIFSHPYMQKVKSADLEYIMSKMIEITLSKPLLFSKKMIDEKIEEVVNYSYIIPAKFAEMNESIKQQLILIQEKHFPYLYKTLFFNLSKAEEANRKQLASYLRRYIIILLTDYIDINGSKYRLETHLAKYPKICWLFFNTPATWEKLNSKYRGILFRYLETEENGITIVEAYKLIKKCDSIDDEYLDMYYNKLNCFNIISSYSLYVNKTLLLDKIRAEYIEGSQYVKQMKYIDFLESFDCPISDKFTDEESKRLGLYLGMCCSNNTFSANSFVRKCSNTWIENLSFCKGVIEGLLCDDGCIRIRPISFFYVLRVFSKLSTANASSILKDLEGFPNNKEGSVAGYKNTIERFEQEKNKIDDVSIQDRLKDLISQYYAPAIESLKQNPDMRGNL